MFQPPPHPPQVSQGDLLLADPSLRDGIFNRSVILLASHSPEGSFGLILNQPNGHLVGDVLQEPKYAALSRIPIYNGGPVGREHLTFAAFWTSPDNELRFAIRIPAEDAIERSKSPGTLVRAFVGYSGWSAGQLEDELEHNSWVVSPAPPNFLSSEHDDELWKNTLRKLSPYHHLLALCPPSPWLN
ncbi:YqgE/AlgH family protein [Roseibacillus ishigakijimensis]|uniref:YqgE/AlgH family protein n=1 Tax=Roseibacillus ishigakijimensis TaxID=454146 RepID=A0A934RSD5_9BACT|nr:YqgE/AlgH family protein [Roseibacillus ishigakijimensis]MBK1834583.1 YqgE/AlgH family protein [Roseibacillus ishigakijimensis]